MKVKRLVINSFRQISNITLDFDETGPTVFIGVNGVGKSSILDCLAILLSQFTGRLQTSPDAIRLFNNQDITYKQQETHNEIYLTIDAQEFTWSLTQRRDEDPLSEIKNQLAKSLEQFSTKIQGIKGEKINPLFIATEQMQSALDDIVSSDLPQEVVEFINTFRTQLEASSEINLPLAVYYPVNRAVLDIPLKMGDKYEFKQIDAYEQSLTGGRIDFKNFFDWFRNREDLENELRVRNSDYQDPQLTAVRHAVHSILPGFENLRVQRSPLQMVVDKQGQEFIINQLSDGEKCLLAMVGDLARRLAIANPSLDNPLQGQGIVLIDEIELHLHPQWQRQIIPALINTFANCQFIVTTHSPQIVSHVKPEGIYLLERTDEGTIVAEKPENSFGRDSNQILEDIMGVPERPFEVKEELGQLFRLIEENHLERARQLRRDLANEIGENDPEFIRADILIRRKEILNK